VGEEELVYLVLVYVHLLGGETVAEADVFEAVDSRTAENMARNTFLQTPEGQAVVYGETLFYPDTISSVRPRALAVLNLDDEDNHPWRELLKLSKDTQAQVEKALGA